jgi:cell division protein FtsI (penicillin-binding protein 3)
MGSPARRQRVVLALVLVALTVLTGRLVQLQGIDRPAYAEAASEQRQRATVLPAPRGSVLDRNGVPLAYSVDSRAITSDNRMVEDPRAAAAALAPLLGQPQERLRQLLSDGERAFVYLARQVDPAVAREIAALRLPGLFSEREPRRLYPGGDLAANVVGFVGSDGHGLGGVEGAMDEVLSGTDGRRTMEVDQQGRQIPTAGSTEVEPVAGHDVVLTIDRDLQWAAQDALARQVEETDSEGGQVVVMDARTGEVLALAVAPTFDASDPSASPAEHRGNPALSQVYEPGSVNKVITAAAALEEGVVRPETVVEVTPFIQVADKRFTDSHPSATTEQFTFTGVLAESSNVGTIDVSLKMTSETLHGYMRAFGYGERSGIGLPGESPGILAGPENWTGSSRGTIPIGQGVSTTSLQIASVYQTIANDGVRLTPTLVRGYRAPRDEDSEEAEPQDGATDALQGGPDVESREVVSARTAREITTMLEAATSDDGTAPQARIEGYRVAGKTGTARRVVDGRYSGYMASFAGYAPADDPRLVVEVVLDNPKTSIYGGTTAAPVFSYVTSFALNRLEVPPSGTVAPPVRLRAD